MMPPFVVFPTNRIAHFVEVSLYLFYLAQQVNLDMIISIGYKDRLPFPSYSGKHGTKPGAKPYRALQPESPNCI